MDERARVQATLQHILNKWPAYLLLYTGLVVALLMVGLALLQGQWLVTLLGFLSFLLLAGILLISLRAAHRQISGTTEQAHEMLFGMSQAGPTDRLLYVDLGLRQEVLDLSRHLTTGLLIVVDIYNPQLTPGAALKRKRQQAPPARNDPRLDWYDSNIDLLPLPDRSVHAVFVNQILSQLAQAGDRKVLLRELLRVLKPNGRLLLAEPVSEERGWLTTGLATLETPTADYWRRLVSEASFQIRREENVSASLLCIRADKPSPYAGQQLALDLNYV